MPSRNPLARVAFFVTALVVLTIWQAAPLGQSAPAASIDEKVNGVFARWDSTATPGCTVAVSVKGQVVLSKAYGMADLEHGAVMTPDTPPRGGLRVETVHRCRGVASGARGQALAG